MDRQEFERRLRHGAAQIVEHCMNLDSCDTARTFRGADAKKWLKAHWARASCGFKDLEEIHHWPSLLFLMIEPGGRSVNECSLCLTMLKEDQQDRMTVLQRQICRDPRTPASLDAFVDKVLSARGDREKLTTLLAYFVEWQLKLRDHFDDLYGVQLSRRPGHRRPGRPPKASLPRVVDHN